MQKQADVTMSFESFAELYEKDVKPRLKENTWLTKESIIKKKFLPYFMKRRLCDITAKDVIEWQNEIRELTDKSGRKYSQTYLKTVHNQLSALFNHAVRYYGLKSNPAAIAAYVPCLPQDAAARARISSFVTGRPKSIKKPQETAAR